MTSRFLYKRKYINPMNWHLTANVFNYQQM